MTLPCFYIITANIYMRIFLNLQTLIPLPRFNFLMKSFFQVAEKKEELSYDDLTNDLCPVSIFVLYE